jgi:hypothetical protein
LPPLDDEGEGPWIAVPEEQPEALAKALPAFLHRESHKKWGYKYSAGRNDWTDELRNRHRPLFT